MDVIEELEGVTIHELTQEQAQQFLDKLAFYYWGGQNRTPGANGGTTTSLSLMDTAGKIRSTYPGLVEQAGMSALTPRMVEVAYKREMRRKWASGRALAADLFYINLQRLEKAMAVIEGILDNDDPQTRADIKLNAIDRLVAVEKRQAAMAGYDAPQKVAVFSGTSEAPVLSEDEKRKIVEELGDWEARQFALNPTVQIIENGG